MHQIEFGVGWSQVMSWECSMLNDDAKMTGLLIISFLLMMYICVEGCDLTVRDVSWIPDSEQICATLELQNYDFGSLPYYHSQTQLQSNQTITVEVAIGTNDFLSNNGINNEVDGTRKKAEPITNVTLSICDTCYANGKMSSRWMQTHVCGKFFHHVNRSGYIDLVKIVTDNVVLSGQSCSVRLDETKDVRIKKREILHSDVCSKQTSCKKDMCKPTCASLTVGDGGSFVCGESPHPHLLPSSVTMKMKPIADQYALVESNWNTLCFAVEISLTRDVEYVQIFEWQPLFEMTVMDMKYNFTFAARANSAHEQCTSFTGIPMQSGSEMELCVTNDRGVWRKPMKAMLSKGGENLVIMCQAAGTEGLIQKVVELQEDGPMDVMKVKTWNGCENLQCQTGCIMSCGAAMKGTGLVKCDNEWKVETDPLYGIWTEERIENFCQNDKS